MKHKATTRKKPPTRAAEPEPEHWLNPETGETFTVNEELEDEYDARIVAQREKGKFISLPELLRKHGRK